MNLFLRISICLAVLVLIGASILFIFNDPLELSYEKHPISYFKRKIKLNPDNASIYYRRGRFYQANDELDKAIADYSMAINLKDNSYMLIYEPRGYAYFKKKEWAKALDDFNKFLEYIKNDAPEYLKYELGDINRAINICKEKQGGQK